jgi:hypothetical protein
MIKKWQEYGSPEGLFYILGRTQPVVLGSGPPVRHWGRAYKPSKFGEYFGVGVSIASWLDYFVAATAAMLSL